MNDYYEKENDAINRAKGKEIITANTDPSKIKPAPNVQVPNFVSTIKKSKK